MKVLIMCKSLTNAQRGALLLERRGISASVVKAPQNLRGNGCGYAISLFRRLQEAVEDPERQRASEREDLLPE